MDTDAVKNMVNTGHATVAHIAKHFETTPPKVEEFMRENGIQPPRGNHEQYKHITKLLSAVRTSVADWESLVWDDANHTRVNGIDSLTTDGRVNAKEIVESYHGELRCMFTGKPTTSVTAFDNNPQNFLISNFVPIDEKIAKERKFGDPLPILVSSKEYEFKNGVKIRLHIHGRFDPAYHAVFSSPYLDALIEQWVEPYFDFTPQQLMPDRVVATPESVSLWLWRHLSTVVLLKGLARLDVMMDGIESSLSKDMYLQMVMALMQRAAQSRAVASGPSGIVLPGQPGFAAPPNRP
jgi:hypothetical protein